MSGFPSEDARSRLLDLLLDLARGTVAPERVRAAKPDLDAVGAGDVMAIVHRAVSSVADMDALEKGVARFMRLASPALEPGRFRGDSGPRFLRSLVRENAALRNELAAARPAIAAIASSPDDVSRGRLLTMAREVEAFFVHYVKKENVLFPRMERRHPQWGCVRVMWGIHDDARDGVREVRGLLAAGKTGHALDAAIGRLFFDLGAVMEREELALFPGIAGAFSPEEWRDIAEEAAALGGYGELPGELRDSDDGAAVPDETRTGASVGDAQRGPAGASSVPVVSATKGGEDPAGAVALSHGSLPAPWLDAALKTLPCDLTFVDAEGKVRYFSDSPRRVFPRSPSIIGRDVRNCHPEKSVARVLAVVEALRSGAKDAESFWIERAGRFIHVEYRAVRDASGAFLGTLEISEDLTEKRALSGEKRL